MGGKTLDIPEVRIYHKGLDEGRAEGEAHRRELQEENDKLRKELEDLKKSIKK